MSKEKGMTQKEAVAAVCEEFSAWIDNELRRYMAPKENPLQTMDVPHGTFRNWEYRFRLWIDRLEKSDHE